MTEVQMEKKAFVEGSFSRMLAEASEGDIASLDYAAEGCEEFVHVVYRNGYRRRVCVTGDSLRAVARDVLEAV